MGAAAEHMDQLSQDIAKATADANQAWDAYQRETDPRLEVKLEARWQQLVRKEEALLAERTALRARLAGPGALREGGKGSSESVSPGMLRFAEWPAKAGEEDESDPWLELPEGVFFLGLSELGSCLYVREAYRKLTDQLEHMRAHWIKHVVINGNPGVGKSFFALWMLVRWLRKGVHVMWHSSGNEFFYFKDGTVSKLSRTEARKVLTNEGEVCYIVDGARPLTDVDVKQSFVAHLPDDSKYNDYMKMPGAVSSPLFMPHWEEEELHTVRIKLHPDVSRYHMGQLIARFGAIPRHVLSRRLSRELDSRDTRMEMDDRIAREASDAVKAWEDIACAVPGSARASHRIAAIHSPYWREGNFSTYKLKFLSMAVRDAVIQKLIIIIGGPAQLMSLVNRSVQSDSQGLVAELGGRVEKRAAAKTTSGMAVKKQQDTKKPAKEQQGTGDAATNSQTAGKRREKKDPGAVSAMLVQSSAGCSTVGSRTQLALRGPARMHALPRLLRPRARAAPPARLLSASCGLQHHLI